MLQENPISRAFVALLLVALSSTVVFAQAGGAAAGGTVATGPVYRVLRTVAGSNVTQDNGRVVVQDTRSAFYAGADKQVVVYFEWQGPTGKHHFQGVWKDPAGNPSAISNFDYDATQPEFGGYWTLLLSGETAPGFWTIEARIDGEVAGTYTVEIRGGAKPADAVSSRQMLTTGQVYAKASQSTVAVEALNGSGDRMDSGVGVVVGDGLVATVFNLIDGASTVNILTSSGQRLPASGVVIYQRWQDWALLKVPGLTAKALAPAPKDSLAVGDHEYAVAWKDGAASIVEANLAGKRDDPRNGPRYTLNANGNPDAGSPVLNDFGELTGLYGAVRYPGLGTPRAFYHMVGGGLESTMSASEMIPVASLPESSGSLPVHTFAELADSGAFLAPLSKDEDLIQGVVGRDVVAKNGMISAPENRSEFSRTNPKLVIDLLWNPRSKVKGLVTLYLYDLDNHPLMNSKPVKVNFNGGSMASSNWTLNIGTFNPGIYRADVLLGPRTIWRTFFKITP